MMKHRTFALFLALGLSLSLLSGCGPKESGSTSSSISFTIEAVRSAEESVASRYSLIRVPPKSIFGGLPLIFSLQLFRLTGQRRPAGHNIQHPLAGQLVGIAAQGQA